ncbi:MAG: hypothetical protein LUE16_02530 [Lachnospiraceae bacterium]|nr:hypothetical protein [Lachnospiraceae bacterium]
MGRLRVGVRLLIMLAGVGIYACPMIREWQFDRQVRAVIRAFEERYQGEADDSDAAYSSAASAASDADAVSANSGDFMGNSGNTESDDQGKIAASDAESDRDGAVGESELSALNEAMLEYNENLLQNGQKLTDA